MSLVQPTVPAFACLQRYRSRNRCRTVAQLASHVRHGEAGLYHDICLHRSACLGVLNANGHHVLVKQATSRRIVSNSHTRLHTCPALSHGYLQCSDGVAGLSWDHGEDDCCRFGPTCENPHWKTLPSLRERSIQHHTGGNVQQERVLKLSTTTRSQYSASQGLVGVPNVTLSRYTCPIQFTCNDLM